MFEYMLKRLNNGRILVRNSKEEVSEVMKPSEIGAYFEKELSDEIKKEREKSDKIGQLKQEISDKDIK